MSPKSTTTGSQIQITIAARSDIGRVRTNNEDAYALVNLASGQSLSSRGCKECQRPSSRRNRSRSPGQVQFRHLAAVATVKSDSNPPLAHNGILNPDRVRSMELDALVDTGATLLALPEEAVDKLGLRQLDWRKVRLADGNVREIALVGDLQLEILGRTMTCDALVMPAGSMALIGQIQLEALDLIVDAKSREARVNPASPDMPLLDLLRVS
jgi:clan AA aspartic protease